MTTEKSPIAMAEFWTRQARTGPRYPESQPLPWSPFQAQQTTAADGTEEASLPNTPPDFQPSPYGGNPTPETSDTP